MSTQTQEPEDQPVDPDGDEYEYRCPFCEVSYGDELLTRVHITRSEDKEHLNYDGFMPEVEIDVVDENGDVVDRLSKRPDELDETDITTSDFPDDLSDQHKHILLVAAHNPYEEIIQNLKELADEELDSAGLDTLSYSTVRRVIREYFQPQEVAAEKEAAAKQTEGVEETLSDLTTKQQAIVIAHIVHPDESTLEIADRIGSATSYPPQVYNRAEHIIERLQKQIEAGEPALKALLADLTPDDVATLAEAGYLDNIDADLVKAVEEGVFVPDTEAWDQPVTGPHAKPMSAGPELGDFDEDADEMVEKRDERKQWTAEGEADAESQDESEGDGEVELETRDGTTTVKTAEASPEPGTGDVGETGVTGDVGEAGGAGRDAIPRREIMELKSKVQFLRRTFERSDDPSDSSAVSLAEQVEEELEAILSE